MFTNNSWTTFALALAMKMLNPLVLLRHWARILRMVMP